MRIILKHIVFWAFLWTELRPTDQIWDKSLDIYESYFQFDKTFNDLLDINFIISVNILELWT